MSNCSQCGQDPCICADDMDDDDDDFFTDNFD